MGVDNYFVLYSSLFSTKKKYKVALKGRVQSCIETQYRKKREIVCGIGRDHWSWGFMTTQYRTILYLKPWLFTLNSVDKF